MARGRGRRRGPSTSRRAPSSTRRGRGSTRVRRLEDPAAGTSVTLSKGVHLVLELPRGLGRGGDDPGRGRTRVSFAIPWAGMLLLGTTDTPFDGDPRRRRASTDDGGAADPGRGGRRPRRAVRRRRARALRRAARAARRAGGTPRAPRETTISRGPRGMVTVAGGKLTTYRRIALAVLHALRPELGLHRIDRAPATASRCGRPGGRGGRAPRRRPGARRRRCRASRADLRHARRGRARARGRSSRSGRTSRDSRPQVRLRARARVGAHRRGRASPPHDARPHAARHAGRRAGRVEELPRRDPRDRPGDDGHDLPRGRRGAPRPRARLPRAAAALPAAGLGRARSGGDLGERRGGSRGRARARRGRAPPSSRAIGITNQRETTVLWERATGRPVAPAIVWQDRRTAERCRELPAELIRERTGPRPRSVLLGDEARVAARANRRSRPSELAFGTVDSWLVWRLTGGRVHVTDRTNASRTMLLDLDSLEWDDELLALFGVDACACCRASSRSSEVVGEARAPRRDVADRRDRRRPAGRARRATAASARGEAKATYGTGSFVLVHAGDERRRGARGAAATTAAAPGAATRSRARSSSSGAARAVAPRRARHPRSTRRRAEALARQRRVDRTASYFVPALTGLGSPHWDPDARGLITGLTRGTTRAHLVRATLEAIALPGRRRRSTRSRAASTCCGPTAARARTAS